MIDYASCSTVRGLSAAKPARLQGDVRVPQGGEKGTLMGGGLTSAGGEPVSRGPATYEDYRLPLAYPLIRT